MDGSVPQREAERASLNVPVWRQLSLPFVDLPEPSRDSAPPPPRAHRIYCNRNLRLDHIRMIGFDMDYTLAIYEQEEMDRLSIEATASKLVEQGYPRSLLTMPYQPHFPTRGLLVDKKLGNVLKADRHRYVKKAYHGTRELNGAERKHIYKLRRVRPGTKRYHSIDTLYALSEVAVYTAVVEALDGDGTEVDYGRLFDDVRASIDAAHRDGSIKDLIARDLPRYVRRDPDLAPTLHRLRSTGKKLFLLTNSGAEYTDVVMRYLLGDALPGYDRWQRYFDVIVTSAGKPRFFTESSPFTDPDRADARVESFERGRVYEGGSLNEFERLVGVGGDQVLYVGDHIFGDVLRAKKQSAWRTLMIIQELSDELDALKRCDADLERLADLEQQRYAIIDAMRERQLQLRSMQRYVEQAEDTEARREIKAAQLRARRSLDRLRVQLDAVDDEYAEIESQVDHVFHPFWGSCFKAGSELSGFGEQVERYACLYSDRVTNLHRYSPTHYFRGPRHRMPHERDSLHGEAGG